MLIPIVGQLMTRVQTRYHHRDRLLHHGLRAVYSQPPRAGHRLQDAGHDANRRRPPALAFLFVPISTIAYLTLPRELNGDATALFSMFRNVFGSIGISLSTALITAAHAGPSNLSVAMGEPFHQPYNELIATYERTLTAMGRAGARCTISRSDKSTRLFATRPRCSAIRMSFSLRRVVAFAWSLLLLPIRQERRRSGRCISAHFEPPRKTAAMAAMLAAAGTGRMCLGRAAISSRRTRCCQAFLSSASRGRCVAESRAGGVGDRRYHRSIPHGGRCSAIRS